MQALFDAAVAAADPHRTIAQALPGPPPGRTVVVGAGKAAASMAAAFDAAWPHPLSGVVVTGYGHGAPCGRIRVLEAAHPVPDAAGVAAARLLIETVSPLGADDLVVALVSGGGSALLPCPPPALTLADEQALNRTLLASGLGIGEMNLLRKHVSGIKGGRLAQAAAPARLLTLVLSDVPGDDPAQVASGPTVPSPGSRADALALVRRARLTLPDSVRAHLESESATAPDPSDRCFAGQRVQVIGSAGASLQAAAMVAERHGIPAMILSDAIEGEAAEIGRMHAALAREIALRDRPFTAPVILLSGGETSVTLRAGSGRGGRNTTFALRLAIDLHGLAGIHALAADTDGIDGTCPGAGAFVDCGSVARLRKAGLDPNAVLAAQDSWAAFDCIGDGLTTGPTRTNVNDFRAILIRPTAPR